MATTKEERIAHIESLMRTLQWPEWPESKKLRQELAYAWGVSEHTVRGYAAEASRNVRPTAEQREALRSQFVEDLLDLSEEARRSTNILTNQPDIANAIKARVEAARLLGLDPEKKVAVSGGIALESIDDLKKRILSGGEGEG